jgi:hypothetical protein
MYTLYISFLSFFYLYNTKAFTRWSIKNGNGNMEREREFRNITMSFLDINKNKNIYNNNNNNNNKNNDFYNGECILPIYSKNLVYRSGYNDAINISEINLYKFYVYNYKLNLLKLLTNDNVSFLNKIYLIDQYKLLYDYPTTYVYNLYAGGLLDNWD